MSKLEAKNTKTFIVALCSIVYFISYFSRKDFAAVMAGMLSENIIEKEVGGFIGMGLFICYGIGQLVSGWLGDKLKPSYLIIFGLGTTALCNALMPIMPSGYAMIPVWALNGFAQAMLWPPIVRILSDNLEHEDFVRANLVVTSAAHISTILLYLYVPLCLTIFDWKTVFFSASILAALAMVVFIASLIVILPKDTIKAPVPRKNKNEKTAVSGESFGSLILRAGIIQIFVCIIMMGFLRDGIESWLPTLYSEAFNRNADESILVSVSLPIFSILSIVTITALHKTKTFKNEVLGSSILFGIAILIAIPTAILINVNTIVARVVCLIFACTICACMHGCNFLLISCLPGRFSKHGKAATTSGFCNAFTYVGAAISMYGMAIVSEKFGWQTTIISWIGIAALGVLFTALSYKSYTKFIKEED